MAIKPAASGWPLSASNGDAFVPLLGPAAAAAGGPGPGTSADVDTGAGTGVGAAAEDDEATDDVEFGATDGADTAGAGALGGGNTACGAGDAVDPRLEGARAATGGGPLVTLGALEAEGECTAAPLALAPLPLGATGGAGGSWTGDDAVGRAEPAEPAEAEAGGTLLGAPGCVVGGAGGGCGLTVACIAGGGTGEGVDGAVWPTGSVGGRLSEGTDGTGA